MPDPELSRLCQCPHPDIVVVGAIGSEDGETFCAICGGDIPYPWAVLYDPLQDVADAKICNRFDCSL